MLTRGEDVEAHALEERGWSISAIARHLGYSQSYPTFVRHIRKKGLRPHCEACTGVDGRETIEIDHPPGEEIQWDWFERRRAGQLGRGQPCVCWQRTRSIDL